MDANINTTGKRIRYLRETVNNWNGSKFRDELKKRVREELKPSTLTNHEKDTSMPGYSTLVNYAKVLGTTTDFLLLVTEDPAPTKKTDRNVLIEPRGEEERRILEEIASLLEELTAGDLRFVLDIIRRISSIPMPASPQMESIDIVALIDTVLDAIEQVGGTDMRKKTMAAMEKSLAPDSPLAATWRRFRSDRPDQPLQGND